MELKFLDGIKFFLVPIKRSDPHTNDTDLKHWCSTVKCLIIYLLNLVVDRVSIEAGILHYPVSLILVSIFWALLYI